MPKQDYKHVAVKPDDYVLLKGIAFGLELTQSAAIAALIRLAMRPGETPVQAGERLLDEWKNKVYNDPSDIPA